MKKSFLPFAAFAAVVFGAAALVASARSSSSISTTAGAETTTPEPTTPAPRSATRDELDALLRGDIREPRPVDDYAAPVSRSHSTIDRKSGVMFPDLSPEVRDAFVIFLYEEVGMSHREISHIVALSPRAIAHRLHAVGAVRYAKEVESSWNRNNSNQ